MGVLILLIALVVLSPLFGRLLHAALSAIVVVIAAVVAVVLFTALAALLVLHSLGI
jgi:hypothetical protein